jgi:hypothetical protein
MENNSFIMKYPKLNKGLSSFSPDFHESGFLKEADEMQEYEDFESITMLQEQPYWTTKTKR